MQAELLTEPHNYAVVQLPTRKFPGVVFQGDSLANLLSEVKELSTLLATGNTKELAEELISLEKHLASIQLGYERVCETHGIKLPY